MGEQFDRQFTFLVAVNALIVVAALALVGPSYTSLFNFQSMGAQVPELGLLALGVMLAMVSGNGGIDLSGIAPGLHRFQVDVSSRNGASHRLSMPLTIR